MMFVRRKPLRWGIGLVVGVLFAAPVGGDELGVRTTRVGLAESEWQRQSSGLIEPMLPEASRYRRTAMGAGVFYRYAALPWLGVETELLTASDLGVVKGRITEWSALGWGFLVGGEWRFAKKDQLVFGGDAGLRIMFSDLTILPGDTVGVRSERTFPLAWGRARFGWDLPLTRDARIRMAVYGGWSEIKPVRYGDLGQFSVGGLQSGLEVSLFFDGFGADVIQRPKHRRPKRHAQSKPAPKPATQPASVPVTAPSEATAPVDSTEDTPENPLPSLDSNGE